MKLKNEIDLGLCSGAQAQFNKIRKKTQDDVFMKIFKEVDSIIYFQTILPVKTGVTVRMYFG
jgi:hypothetical protein